MVHRIDVHVGARMRSRRKILGITQNSLATSVDLTFQQIQKYERGTNRISSSRLYTFANLLNVPVTYFFEGVESDAEKLATLDNSLNEQLENKETSSLINAYYGIKDEHVRKRIIALMKKM